MYRYATANQSRYFNDYRYTARADANWSIIYNIRATYRPIAVTVAAGAHEALVVGYRTDHDPAGNDRYSNTFLGFHIFDPWYGRGSAGLDHWPSNGFAPNYFVSASSWNANYFLPDTEESGTEGTQPNYYNNKYVIVARKRATGPPEDIATNTLDSSLGEWLYGSSTLAAAQADTADQGSILVAAATLEESVDAGLRRYGLIGDNDWGLDLTSYRVGRSVDVTSHLDGARDYTLAELVIGGSVRAIVMVDRVPAGYLLAGVAPVETGTRLPTTGEITRVVRDAGPWSHVDVGWTWVEGGPGPFSPFAVVRDAGGRERYFAPSGTELRRLDIGHDRDSHP